MTSYTESLKTTLCPRPPTVPFSHMKGIKIDYPRNYKSMGPISSHLTERQQNLISGGWPTHAFEYPVEVISNVWLSGIAFEDDIVHWCYKNGFTHIVNAAGSYGRSNYYKSHPNTYGIQYLELEMDDLPSCELRPYVQNAYDFVETAIKDDVVQNKILIHCIWGQSRSVSCLIYFIMTHWRIKYDAALNIVKRVRPCAKPNSGFDTQLRVIDISRYSTSPPIDIIKPMSSNIWNLEPRSKSI